MITNRIPIIDKNGKATHVRKRTSHAPAPTTRVSGILPTLAAINQFGDDLADEWMPDFSGALDGLYTPDPKFRPTVSSTPIERSSR